MRGRKHEASSERTAGTLSTTKPGEENSEYQLMPKPPLPLDFTMVANPTFEGEAFGYSSREERKQLASTLRGAADPVLPERLRWKSMVNL